MTTPSVVWLTGLSGAGKSSIALALQTHCVAQGKACVVLDGDALRQELCRDLGFSRADRAENVRRAAELAKLIVRDSNALVVVALISPFAADRQRAREIIGHDLMLEVFISTPLSVCESRDPKGFYRRARAHRLTEFTGITSPYEAPTQPDLTLDTAQLSLDACVALLAKRLAINTPNT